MKNGRINERNIGKYRMDGRLKGNKLIKIDLSDEELKIREAISLCKMILKDGVKLYDGVPDLVQHWLDKGIARIKKLENSCIMARTYKPFEKRAILIENKRDDVKLVMDLMISLYHIK